jgi:hypothetical protein
MASHVFRPVVGPPGLMSRTKHNIWSLAGIQLPEHRSLVLKRATHASHSRCPATTVPVFPPSITIDKQETYSLRMYEPFVALEAPYQKREDGYDALASYFGGMNTSSLRFAESQPCILNYYPDGCKCMQMYIGCTCDGTVIASDSFPQPLLDQCKLVAAGGELCAVLRFTGYITSESATTAVANLKSALAAKDIALAEPESNGFFRICQYGPVYSFSGRENEVLLRIQL